MCTLTTDLLRGLNEQQLAAVTLPAQHALILAGAGSGHERTCICVPSSDRPSLRPTRERGPERERERVRERVSAPWLAQAQAQPPQASKPT